MFGWQIALLVAIACMATLFLTRPCQGKFQKILRFLLAWITPYICITVAFTAVFMQTWPVALVFFATAACCYLIFLQKNVE